jgi:hypothetical protein
VDPWGLDVGGIDRLVPQVPDPTPENPQSHIIEVTVKRVAVVYDDVVGAYYSATYRGAVRIFTIDLNKAVNHPDYAELVEYFGAENAQDLINASREAINAGETSFLQGFTHPLDALLPGLAIESIEVSEEQYFQEIAAAYTVGTEVGAMVITELAGAGLTRIANSVLAEVRVVNQGVGRLTGSLEGLTDAEKRVISDLRAYGKDVEIIPRDLKAIDKTPDYRVNGVKTELKTLAHPNTNTGMKRVQEGFAQGGKTVIIDGRDAGLTTSQAQEIINRAAGKYPNGQLPGTVEIWINEGIIRYP